MQGVNPPHDRKLGLRHSSRFIVEAAPAEPQQLCLPHQRQFMRPVDQRFALSRPALLSAPAKKSFSKISSPILACRVFTSTTGAASPAALPEPNNPAAASTKCPFQAVIWFGCTSYCCANSASVFSPLMAAKATFALKAGACVRRTRLVIVAPDQRHSRRSQAELPLIDLSEFGQPPQRAVVLARRRKNLTESTRRTYLRRLDHDLNVIMGLTPGNPHGKRLRQRYGKVRNSLFTFLEHPDASPDNNGSERELRPTATYRKVTGGFRSTWGADLFAAVRSVVGTAARRGRDAYQAIRAVLDGETVVQPG